MSAIEFMCRLKRSFDKAAQAASDSEQQRPRTQYKHRLLIFGLSMCFFSIFAFLGSAISWQRDIRLAHNTAVVATVTKSWIETGKAGGNYASLSYGQVRDGSWVHCEVARVRIGIRGVPFNVGDPVEIVPRSNSCYEPDVLFYNNGPNLPLILLVVSLLLAVLGTALIIAEFRFGLKLQV